MATTITDKYSIEIKSFGELREKIGYGFIPLVDEETGFPVESGTYSLNVFENDTVVDIEQFTAAGFVKKVHDGVAILGNGDLTKKLTVKAAKFTKSAIEKIEAAGGKAEVI